MPYNQLNIYIGEYASDAAADAIFATNSWTKYEGHIYKNTTDDTLRVWVIDHWHVISPPGTAPDVYKSFTLTTQGVGTGRFYAAGYYEAPAADANLNQGSTTQTLGTANRSYAAHAFLVAGGAGTVDAGSCSITVTGTSITDDGVRTAADSETIVADITAMAQDDYYETVKKWIGTVTYTLVPAGAATFAADFNFGWCKYDDLNNADFTIKALECVGLAGATDTGFNIELLLHSDAGWTYSAAAFVPGGTVIASMNADHVTETDLTNGEPFAYKRANLSQVVDGSASEGFIFRVTTGAANAIEFMDLHVGADWGV